MVSADFCTAAILISAGAILGRVNPVQMLLLTLLGVTLFSLNEYILLSLMGVRHQPGAHQKGGDCRSMFRLLISRPTLSIETNPIPPLPAQHFLYSPGKRQWWLLDCPHLRSIFWLDGFTDLAPVPNGREERTAGCGPSVRCLCCGWYGAQILQRWNYRHGGGRTIANARKDLQTTKESDPLPP